MAGWTNEQTKVLLGLWSAADVQAQLNVVSVAIVHHTCIAAMLYEGHCGIPARSNGTYDYNC